VDHLLGCPTFTQAFTTFYTLASALTGDQIEVTRDHILMGLDAHKAPLPAALNDLHTLVWKIAVWKFTTVDIEDAEDRSFCPLRILKEAARQMAVTLRALQQRAVRAETRLRITRKKDKSGDPLTGAPLVTGMRDHQLILAYPFALLLDGCDIETFAKNPRSNPTVYVSPNLPKEARRAVLAKRKEQRGKRAARLHRNQQRRTAPRTTGTKRKTQGPTPDQKRNKEAADRPLPSLTRQLRSSSQEETTKADTITPEQRARAEASRQAAIERRQATKDKDAQDILDQLVDGLSQPQDETTQSSTDPPPAPRAEKPPRARPHRDMMSYRALDVAWAALRPGQHKGEPGTSDHEHSQNTGRPTGEEGPTPPTQPTHTQAENQWWALSKQ